MSLSLSLSQFPPCVSSSRRHSHLAVFHSSALPLSCPSLNPLFPLHLTARRRPASVSPPPSPAENQLRLGLSAAPLPSSTPHTSPPPSSSPRPPHPPPPPPPGAPSHSRLPRTHSSLRPPPPTSAPTRPPPPLFLHCCLRLHLDAPNRLMEAPGRPPPPRPPPQPCGPRYAAHTPLRRQAAAAARAKQSSGGFRNRVQVRAGPVHAGPGRAGPGRG